MFSTLFTCFTHRIHLIIGQKVLKIKKSNLFLFLPVTLRKTIEKTKFAKILSFHVEKWGSQAGVHPISTPSGSRRVPLLSTPHFPTWKHKITAHLVFPTVSRNCYWKKEKQITISYCRIMSTLLVCVSGRRSFHAFSTFTLNRNPIYTWSKKFCPGLASIRAKLSPFPCYTMV